MAGSQIQGAAQGVVNRIVDLAYDFTPEGVSRSVVSATTQAPYALKEAQVMACLLKIGCAQVETATKGALVLLGLAFAQTILSVSKCGLLLQLWLHSQL